MKTIIIVAFIACAGAAKLNKSYLPPNYAQTSGGSGDFLQTPVNSASYNGQGTQDFNAKTIARIGNEYPGVVGRGVEDRNVNAYENYNSRPERPRAALERSAAILRQVNDNNGEAYSYAYETENGIVAEENGIATNGVEAQGGYSYTGDDGQVYTIRYTAGQNGFVPEGDHLPTPPPVPEEILMALEQNARDEAAGIYDDGSYKENKYASAGNGLQNSNFVKNLNGDDAVVVNSAVNGGFAQNNQRNQAEVIKAYLPPISGRRPPVDQNKVRFGNVNRQPTFNSRNGYNY